MKKVNIKVEVKKLTFDVGSEIEINASTHGSRR